jgi:hypothetical protein
MFKHYKKIAFKKKTFLLYNKIDELKIFRHSSETDKNVIEIIENINNLEDVKIRNELLNKIICKIVSYSKLNLIAYNEKTIIKLNEIGLFSPLKYCCYSEKYSSYNTTIINNIIEIIKYLLEICGLSVMEVYDDHNYKETIFDILCSDKNTVSIILKNNIYNYLINDCKRYILQDFEKMIFNLKNNEKIEEYGDKMKFIMSIYEYETFEIIIKFLSLKYIINNISVITIAIFSKNYNNKNNNVGKEDYNFLDKCIVIFDIMIKNIDKYINNINIYNFLNFLWTILLFTDLKESGDKLLKKVLWDYVIIRINNLIIANTERSKELLTNFMFNIDIFTINFISKYLKINKIVF